MKTAYKLFIVLVLLQIIDIVTTYVGVVVGDMVELNKHVEAIIEYGFHAFILLKIVVLLLIYGWIKFTECLFSDEYLFSDVLFSDYITGFFMLVFIVLMAYVCANNIYFLLL